MGSQSVVGLGATVVRKNSLSEQVEVFNGVPSDPLFEMLSKKKKESNAALIDRFDRSPG